MCPDMTHEQAFIQAMANANKYVVKDSRIQIRRKNKVLIELAPNAADHAATQVLPSGKWYVLSIESDNGPQQVTGSKAYLQFDHGSKQVSGNGSCNGISGPLKMEATEKAKGTIEIGNMISTMMACPEMNVESLLLKALQEVNSWEQQSQTLLLKKDGKVLVTLGQPIN
jgi:heat shock protein HslJ